MTGALIRTLRAENPYMVGDDIRAVRRACLLFNGEPASKLTQKQQGTYGPGMEQLIWRAEDQASITHVGEVVPGGPLMGALRRADAIDAYGDFLLTKYAAQHPLHKVPDLGPIYRGGRSLLLQDLTHETGGVPGYPAFDDGWKAGRAVIAPERILVTQQSGAQGGDAFYCRGDSTIEYWIGHVVTAPATGTRFRKGATLGTIANIPYYDGGPHVHTGIDAKPLIGHELVHKTNYTHGAPTVGEQIRKWAAL